MSDSTYKPTQLMLDWHDALLEPGRKQTTGRLGRITTDGTVSNCCLGVLAEVAGNGSTEYLDADGLKTGNLVYNGPSAENDHVMPSRFLVRTALGKATENGDLTVSEDINVGLDSDGMTITAADLNDDFDFTFAEIAEQVKTVYIDGTGNHRDYQIPNLRRHENDGEC